MICGLNVYGGAKAVYWNVRTWKYALNSCANSVVTWAILVDVKWLIAVLCKRICPLMYIEHCPYVVTAFCKSGRRAVYINSLARIL
jgi:hypothetical protein